MAALVARGADSRTMAFPTTDYLGAPFVDHALATLAAFAGTRCSAGDDIDADLAAGLLDEALLLASSLAPDTDDTLVLHATLTSRARDDVVAALRGWLAETHAPAPESPAGAMAVLETFQRSRSSLALDAASFVVGTPTSAARLAPTDPAAAAVITFFASAPASAWCPEGRTRLLVLTRQSIGGPLPTAPAVWNAATRTQALAVLRAVVRTGTAD
jgi:hypothetical protein